MVAVVADCVGVHVIAKLLVANRGEIAVRIFRAAYELGIRSVAIHTPDDRGSVHRVKADEAYEIGEAATRCAPTSTPTRSSRSRGASVPTRSIPATGFSRRTPSFAAACAREGITFVGPPPRVMAIAGNKLRARDAARDAGVSIWEP